MTIHHDERQHAILLALLRAIPAQPVQRHHPLVRLRPLFDGTMTIETALSPTTQEAIAACEQLAYQREGKGRSLCHRISELPPVPATRVVAGW